MVKPPDDPANGPSDTAETRPDISTITPRPVVEYRPDDTLPATNFEDIDSILSDAPPRPRDPLPGSKKARVSINDAAGQSAVTLGGASAVRKGTTKPSGDAVESPPAATTGSSSTILPAPLPADGSSLSAKGGSKVTGSKVTGSKVVKSPSELRKAAPVEQCDPATIAAAVAPTVSGGASASDSTGEGTSPYPFAGDASALPAEAIKTSWWHWPLITAAVGAGVLLAVSAVYLSFVLLSPSPQPIAKVSAVPPTTTEPTADQEPAQAEQTPTAEPTVPPAAPALPVDESDTAPAPAKPVDPMPPTEPADEAVAAATPPAPGRQPAAGGDPLGILPEAAPEPKKPTEPKTVDPLAGFGNLIDAPTADPIPVEQSSGTAGVDLSDVESSAGSESRPSLRRPEPRTVDVAARLADPLPAIEVDGVPLTDYLRFFQDLSTIPITLQPDALWFARATATSNVRTKGQNLSVADALTGGLKPLGLEFQPVEDQLVVRLIEPSPLPKIQYPIKDLAAGDEQQAALLAEWMQSLVQPQSWGEGLGNLTVNKDTIATQQTRAIHSELLQLFEKLRVARGQRPLSRFDATNFSLETRLTRAKAKLETPIKLNFSQPTLLTKIVDRLEEAAGIRILIDWQSLETAGWNPDGEATLLVENKPLSDALTQLTERMDLTWRAIDATTFEILTPQAAAQKLELEFYPLPEALIAATAADEGEALLARLRSTLGDDHFREADGRCDLRYDVASKHLLASLPQPLQQKLAALLAEAPAGDSTAEVK